MFTAQIIKSLSVGECPDLIFDNDQEYKPFGDYIDTMLDDGLLIKHGEYDFSGEGFAVMINQQLTDYQLTAVRSTDTRLDTKAKGQAVYFVLSKNGTDVGSLIWTFSHDPFHLFTDF